MQRQSARRWFALGLPAVLFVMMLLAVGYTGIIGRQASADPQDPDLPPPFTGTAVTLTIDLPAEYMREEIVLDLAETPIYTETFESGLPASWLSIDNNGTSTETLPINGLNTWDSTTITNGISLPGTRSMWSIAGGDGPVSDTYPVNVDTLLRYGPVDLSDVSSASIQFDYLLDVNNTLSDTFSVLISHDGLAFFGAKTNLPTPNWTSSSMAVDSEYIGDDSVWFAFHFQTSTQGDDNLGALVDNFILSTEPIVSTDTYLPIIRRDNTPTPAPPSSYRDTFDNGTTGWNIIRRRNTDGTPDNNVFYQSGYLQLETDSSNDYFIVSPLVKNKAAPYEIRLDAAILPDNDSEKDESGFSIIFGGDYNEDPNSCPNSTFNGCFNDYYAVQVRYRDGDRTQVRVVRIAQHDSNNQPINIQDLTGWRLFESSEVDGDGQNVWNVVVNSDGRITVYVNSDSIFDLAGPRTITNQYFGLGIFAEEGDVDAGVQFYDYCVGEVGNACDTGGGQPVATSTPNPSGTEFSYEFNSIPEINEWRDSSGQGHNRTLGAETDNLFELNIDQSTSPFTFQSVLLELRKRDQFVIYSPLDPIDDAVDEYAIESAMFLKNTTSFDEFGIVFAANWDTTKPCPNSADDFNSCMSAFYVMRVRWLSPSNSIVQLGKVGNSRNPSGNFNIEVLAETNVTFNTEGVRRYRVEYDRNTGDMAAYANDSLLLTAQDSQFADQDYFGLLGATTPGNNLASTIIDYYRVTEQ